MIQSFKMVFDANRISTQKIREIIEELTELGVYDSKTGMVSYDNDDKVLEQKIIAILDNIVQKPLIAIFRTDLCKRVNI